MYHYVSEATGDQEKDCPFHGHTVRFRLATGNTEKWPVAKLAVLTRIRALHRRGPVLLHATEHTAFPADLPMHFAKEKKKSHPGKPKSITYDYYP